ncbi:MAG: lysophospholipid acyltransferase family protein [Frankiaceae bacterium]
MTAAPPTLVTALARLAATTRRLGWRGALWLTGGLAVDGPLPTGPCVVVANHCSHADAPALLAALPAAQRPVVAAAADHWFASGWRRRLCRTLVGGFPVRRTGGGSADLAAAAGLLAAGRSVVVFPEGTRSRTGELGRFHSGAVRLAAAAGVPVVPAAVTGTGRLLPVDGGLGRAAVAVRFGPPAAAPDAPALRAAVEGLLAAPAPRPDSTLRRRVAALAASPLGVAVVLGWALAEALCWPVLPEVALALLAAAAPRRAPRLVVAAAAGSVAGGLLGYVAAARGLVLPHPLVTPRMAAWAAHQLAADGPAGVLAQPMSGVPFKAYVAAAGRAHVSLEPFLLGSALARGARFAAVTGAAALAAALAGRARRYYPVLVATVATLFPAALAQVVRAWS